MTTKQLHDRTVEQTTKVGGIGEDRGGIPIIAGLTFLMVVVILFALCYLFFTAPSTGNIAGRLEGNSYNIGRTNQIQDQRFGATAPSTR